ncbi:acyltransferase [Fundidesulfovibrio putealis]|uniref:acyltransferase n=1 Tax=Fundidesulfovibrio putealis TaxID=270496 RepID=UPI002E1BF6BE
MKGLRESLKRMSKRMVSWVFVAVSLPVYILYRVSRCVVRDERVFCSFSQAYSLVPGFLGVYLRMGFYRLAIDKCPENIWVGFGTFFTTDKVALGSNVYIGSRCIVSNCKIGDDVIIGSGVSVTSGKATHSIDDCESLIRLQGSNKISVSIGDDCWIGNGAIIMSDVNAHSVVGAGCVHNKTFPEYSVVAGNPARLIRSRLG